MNNLLQRGRYGFVQSCIAQHISKEVRHIISLKKIFLFFFLFICTLHPQKPNELHSSDNIKKFADYLFAEKDFLRSVIEYEKLEHNDTIEIKIAIAYQKIGKYDMAVEKFSAVKPNSVFFNKSQKEYYKTLILAERYDEIKNQLTNNAEKDFQRLLYLSYLFSSNELPESNLFLEPFPSNEQEKLFSFYSLKKDPPYKSPFFSGLLSALIPGSGKIYTGDIGDGITAFIAVSLLSFLSYDNFTHNHNFRGWLFAGLGFFFYTGNIYGSAASAQIFNARIDYEYNANLKEYLQNKNYFLPENDFIK